MIEWIWHADYELLHISIFSNICQAQSTHHSLLKYLPILLRESLDSLSDIVAYKKDIFRTGIYLVNGKKCRINLFACLIWFQSDILDQGWETGELIFIRGSLHLYSLYISKFSWLKTLPSLVCMLGAEVAAEPCCGGPGCKDGPAVFAHFFWLITFAFLMLISSVSPCFLSHHVAPCRIYLQPKEPWWRKNVGVVVGDAVKW